MIDGITEFAMLREMNLVTFDNVARLHLPRYKVSQNDRYNFHCVRVQDEILVNDIDDAIKYLTDEHLTDEYNGKVY